MPKDSFITSHKSLLEDKGRLRVAQQLHAILKDWYGKDNLKQLQILDYGCSNGTVTNFIAKVSKKVVGVDVDEIAIKEARQKYKQPKLSFYLTNNEKIPFEDRLFDLVICNQVYSYLDNPTLMIHEIYRVLKKDGTCLFTGDNLLRPLEPLYNLPFIRLLPKRITMQLLKVIGYKNVYLGNYKTYWGLRNLCQEFEIYDYTLEILKNPTKFKYERLERYSAILSIIPRSILKITEPFSPSFIFILKKN